MKSFLQNTKRTKLPQILEQKTIFHHDYECSMQMSLKAYVYAESAWKK